MHDFEDFLTNLNRESGIPFKVSHNNNEIIYDCGINFEGSNVIYLDIFLGKLKAVLIIENKYKDCISLLRYVIEEKYKEFYSEKEKAVINILKGKENSDDEINKKIPFITKGCTLYLISVDGNVHELINIINELYTDHEIVCFKFGDEIVVIGNFNEREEHARSIRESIESELFCKTNIFYAEVVHSAQELKKAYEDAKECLILKKKFNIKEEIINYNDILFEKLIYYSDEKVQEEFFLKFKDMFDAFDKEMIKTIEEFIKCDLNISDTAKSLFVHRNTLIYRIEKIKKETNLDIRNFKEAVIFVTAFLIWKIKRTSC